MQNLEEFRSLSEAFSFYCNLSEKLEAPPEK